MTDLQQSGMVSIVTNGTQAQTIERTRINISIVNDRLEQNRVLQERMINQALNSPIIIPTHIPNEKIVQLQPGGV